MHFGRKRYMFQKNKNTRKTTKILKNFFTIVSSISFEKTNRLALLLKFEKMIRLSTRQQTVGGGGSPQKSSMLMNNGSNSMMIDNHHHHHNGNHHRFRNKKHDSLQQQQQQQSNNVNNNHKANNNHHVKFRSSPQHHHNHQQYQHNHHAKINRTSPLKELQASNSNVKKFYDSLNVDSHYHHHQQHNHHHHHSIIDSNNKTEMMKDLFAGSKSLVTPSPSDLPKPPQNWMKIMNDNNNNVNVSDGIIINNNIVNNLDKTKNDDCQISSNGSNTTKTSIKFEDLLELKAMDTIVRSIGANVVNCSDSMMITTRSKKQQSSPKIMAMFKQQSPQSIAMANNRLIKQY